MTIQDVPGTGNSLRYEFGFSVLIGLYSLLSSIFSDWVSQLFSNIFGISESKSLPLLLLLVIAAISIFAIQRVLEKIDPDPIGDKTNSNKLFAVGSFFSVIILIRVTNPCWADCLPCDTGDPWSPLITYSMASLPMILAAGYSHLVEKNKVFSQYLFENAFSNVHHRITEALLKPNLGSKRYVTDKEVVEYFYEEGVFRFRSPDKNLETLYISKARQKMYLYILTEKTISDSSGNTFRVYLDTSDFAEWKIRGIRQNKQGRF